MSTATANPDLGSHVRHALRVGVAGSVCLVLAEWWGLTNGNLAVWTTYLVMAQYPFTIFQKGLERIVGRGVGIVTGLLLATCFRDAPLLLHVLTFLAMVACFYVYFAGRLAYTFLNAGLFCLVLVHYGAVDSLAAQEAGKNLFQAIVLGVVVADVFTWTIGFEHNLHIDVGTTPLWPIRGDWVNHSLMLGVTALLTRTATTWLQMPADQAVISVLMLSITPDVQAALQKGELRLLGAVLATGWSMGTYLLLGQMPHFPLLVLSIFAGIFLAAYLTRVGESYSYAGVQMGLVLPLLLAVPLPEFGSLAGVFMRLQGIVAAMSATVLVGSLWPHFPLQPPPPPRPPGSIDPK